MFLLNDINVRISPSLRLFMDDCVLYRVIESDQTKIIFSQILANLIFSWSQSWQMWLNVNKCVTLKCNRSLQPSCLPIIL